MKPSIHTWSVRSPGYVQRGGPVAPTVNEQGAPLAGGQWRHLLILVHGFNNSLDEAAGKYATYIDDILAIAGRDSRVLPDAIVGFHWPGNEAVGPFSFMDFAGYPVDVERALQTAAPFAAKLRELLAERPGMRRLSLVGHSLGCRVILEALRRIGRTAVPPFAVVNLMAPAVPVELAAAGRGLADTPAMTARLLKAHSRADWVLWLAFPPGQYAAWAIGVEAAAYGEAIGRHGNPPGFGDAVPRPDNGHGDYWTDKAAAQEMLSVMDATLRGLPTAMEIVPRELVPTGAAETRSLPSRGLPS